MFAANSKQYKIGPYTTSEKEIKDLTLAWVMLSLAFAIALGGGFSFTIEFLIVWFISAVTVGTGFICHELGHKITAQRFGCFAEFRASFTMLLLAVAMSFTGIIFAAPGAVMISGYVNNITNGKISASGPIVNIILAAMFLFLSFFIPAVGVTGMIIKYGYLINTWLALFNMIPVGILDGAKVLKWNKNVYGGIVAVGVVFLLFGGV